MPAKSKAQFRLMKAAEYNPKIAKKVGISEDVAKEYTKSNVGKKAYAKLPEAKKNGGSVPWRWRCWLHFHWQSTFDVNFMMETLLIQIDVINHNIVLHMLAKMNRGMISLPSKKRYVQILLGMPRMERLSLHAALLPIA